MSKVLLLLAIAGCIAGNVWGEYPARADTAVTTRETPVQLTPAELDQRRKLWKESFTDLNRRKKLWEENLTKVAEREMTPLVIKIDPKKPVINTNYQTPSGVLAMQALQRAIKLRWEQIDGVQVFAHDWKVDEAKNKKIIANWLSNLPREEQKSLFKQGVLLDAQDSDVRDAILDVMNTGWQGVNLSFALLDTADQVRVFLRFLPTVEYQKPDQKEMSAFTLDAGVESTFGLNKQDEESTFDKFMPMLPSSKSAPLTFENEILSLDDILKRASNVFHEDYSVDSTQAQILFFASGSMSKSTFEKVLLTLKSPDQIVPQGQSNAEDNASLQVLSQALLKDRYAELAAQKINAGGVLSNKKAILMKDFLDGYAANVEQFQQEKPELLSVLGGKPFPPKTHIHLTTSLVMFVASPGVHFIGESYLLVNGNPVPSVEDNIGRFDLSE